MRGDTIQNGLGYDQGLEKPSFDSGRLVEGVRRVVVCALMSELSYQLTAVTVLVA